MTKKQNDQPSIRDTVLQIRKKFGEESIMTLDEKAEVEVEIISTGSLGLDIALGIGGLPRGRIIEVYGPESSGKTTLALHIIAEAQKQGLDSAYIDAEHALDPEYAQKIGVQINKVLISQPSNGEEAMQIVDTLVRSKAVGVIVIDSVAALTPRAEIEGEIGDIKIGAQARLMSQSLRVLTGSIDRSNTLVIFINQIRMNINAMFGGNPEVTSGGKALKFYASVRLEIRRIGAVKKGEEPIGSRVRIKVVKNKVSAPFGVAEMDVLYNEGISREAELLIIGEKTGILQKAGNGFVFGEEKFGRGYESARQHLAEKTELAQAIREAILKKYHE